MKTRQLLKSDLPRRRIATTSLHIPVVHKGKKGFVCDIHFVNKELCYLEKGKGIPFKISNLQLLMDSRSKEDIMNEIIRKKINRKKLAERDKKLQLDIMKLKNDLRESI
jgi:hypothetical protein